MSKNTSTLSQMSADQSPTTNKSAQQQSVDDEYEDAEKNYQPKSLKFWTLLAGVYLSIFLVVLEKLIVTAIPKVTDEFKFIEDIGWYGSSYMLAAACLFPISAFTSSTRRSRCSSSTLSSSRQARPSVVPLPAL